MNDEAKVQTAEPTKADTAQLVAAIALALGGIAAYYVLQGRPQVWLPWVAMFGGFALALVVFGFSRHGRDFWQFVLESRVELRKVFWPSRQETGMTTLIVFGFVAIAATFFWILDLFLAYVTRAFTGQGS